MINRHAILLREDTIEKILREINIDRVTIDELLRESHTSRRSFYILADRLHDDGRLRWMTLTSEEFFARYGTDNHNRFDNNWSKV